MSISIHLSALLPTGSEERVVLGLGIFRGNIPVVILPSRQDMKTICIYATMIA